MREVGWHHATLTQFVSPFVAGRIYGLNQDQMVAAAGISGSSHFTLGGVVAGHLTNMKNTADPLATQAGVLAALMAREGYEGPVEVIEGKEGFQHVIHNVELKPEILLEGLGEKFMITDCGYKAFPTEALTHQPMSAVLNIMQKEGRRRPTVACTPTASATPSSSTRASAICWARSRSWPTTRSTPCSPAPSGPSPPSTPTMAGSSWRPWTTPRAAP